MRLESAKGKAVLSTRAMISSYADCRDNNSMKNSHIIYGPLQ
jgi:hypothetical protein